jgi:hypothetical protein
MKHWSLILASITPSQQACLKLEGATQESKNDIIIDQINGTLGIHFDLYDISNLDAPPVGNVDEKYSDAKYAFVDYE